MTENDLSPASITRNLGTRLIGKRILYYPQMTSTNDAAREEARQGAAEGTVVITDEQTAGKGRLKRVWLTPKGNIALSLILRPPVAYLPYLVMVASLAVVHAIEAVTALKAQIKWPNDILINGKKVCGILTESEVRGNAVNYAVIGIGVNVNFQPSEFPEMLSTATSLVAESGREVPRLDLIRCLMEEAERLYLALPAGGETIYEEWRDRLVTLGKQVRVKSGKIVLEGVAESVAKDGTLLLRHSDGRATKIVAEDVTLGDY